MSRLEDFLKRNDEATAAQAEVIAEQADRLAVRQVSTQVPWLVEPGTYSEARTNVGYYQTANRTKITVFSSQTKTDSVEDPYIMNAWRTRIYLPPEPQQFAGGLALGLCHDLSVQQNQESRASFERRNDVDRGRQFMKKLGVELPPASQIDQTLSTVARENPGTYHMRLASKTVVYTEGMYLDQSDEASHYLKEAEAALKAGDKQGGLWALLRGIDTSSSPLGLIDFEQTTLTRRQATRFCRLLARLSLQAELGKSPLIAPSEK